MRHYLTILVLPALLSMIGCAGAARKSGVSPQPADTTPPSICEVHHVAMQTKSVPIYYGLPFLLDYDLEMMKAARISFPHALDYIEGGCDVSDENPTSAEVYWCPVCRAEKEKWKERNPIKK